MRCVPNGDFVIESGDKLHITGISQRCCRNLCVNRCYKHKVKTAIIIGGGRISFYLAKQLL